MVGSVLSSPIPAVADDSTKRKDRKPLQRPKTQSWSGTRVKSQETESKSKRHLSPRSQTMAQMTAFSTRELSRRAAEIAPPEETPARIPSVRASARVISSASRCCITMILSTRFPCDKKREGVTLCHVQHKGLARIVVFSWQGGRVIRASVLLTLWTSTVGSGWLTPFLLECEKRGRRRGRIVGRRGFSDSLKKRQI